MYAMLRIAFGSPAAIVYAVTCSAVVQCAAQPVPFGDMVLVDPAPVSLELDESINDEFAQLIVEAQDVTLLQDLEVNETRVRVDDNGWYSQLSQIQSQQGDAELSAGLTVNSFLIHVDTSNQGTYSFGVISNSEPATGVVFDLPVIGIVMRGVQLEDSDPVVGLSTTTYHPTQGRRRLELTPGSAVADEFRLSEDRRTVEVMLRNDNLMDEMRIITLNVDPDFDVSGTFDCADVDALTAAIASGSTNLQFDLTGDQLIDHRDLEEWLRIKGLLDFGHGLLPGDANLDGLVDGQDFLVWNSNRFTTTPAWCRGDFDANGVVNGEDFLVWNEYKFQMAGAAVPEGTNAVFIGSVLLVLWATVGRNPLAGVRDRSRAPRRARPSPSGG